MFAAIGLGFFIARRAAGERAAIVAAVMTALYPPLPYFGSLIVTELGPLVATAAILACLRRRANRAARNYVFAGALFTAQHGPPGLWC